MTISDKYRFEIIAPGFGSYECFPVNNELKFRWQRDREMPFIFRKKLTTTLRFVNDSRTALKDFDKLYALESSRIYKCENVFFNIYKKCNGSETIWWSGKLAFVEGEFDVDHCILEILPRSFDVYDCIFAMWEKDLNIFAGINAGKVTALDRNPCRNPDEVVLTTADYESAFIETRVCTKHIANLKLDGVSDFSDECLVLWNGQPDKLGWKMKSNIITYDNNTSTQSGTVTTTWVREKVRTNCLNGTPVPPPGDGWILYEFNCSIGSLWVRPPLEINFDADGKYKQLKFVNGRYLNDVIKYLVGDWQNQICFSTCKYKVKSNFFGIDPDANPNPTNNIAYQKAVQRCWHLVIHHITDIARWDLGQPATLNYVDESKRPQFITLKKLLNDLKVMFNVHWLIDESTQPPTLRIEHYSYFKKNFMLDLVLDSVDGKTKYYNYTNGLHKYTYNKENLPKKEFFKFMYPTDIAFNGDFDGFPIEYNENCSSSQDETLQCELFTTNVNHIISNSDKFEGSEGYVLIESNGNGHFMYDGGLISHKPKLNGFLSFANLHYNFHRHGRPQRDGKINSLQQQFKSYKKQKVQKLRIPFCCNDIIQFNPTDLVKTQLGWGDVNDAVYSEPSEVLELELHHS